MEVHEMVGRGVELEKAKLLEESLSIGEKGN